MDHLGFPLEKIPVRPDAVGRYLKDPGPHTFPFFADDEFGHVSTGGGAALTMLAGEALPGVEVIEDAEGP